MSNPIKDAIEGIASSFDEFRKTNDERLAAEEAGNKARAMELNEKLDAINADIANYEKAKKEAARKDAVLQERVEILESLNDRPGKSIEEKATAEYKNAFVGALRGGFRDPEGLTALKDATKKANSVKAADVRIGTEASGGYAVPEEISRAIDRLMLARSDVLNEVKMVQVGTSDYKELVSINEAGAAWIAETGTRDQQTTPDLRQVTPTWGELYSYMFATEWSLQDSFFNVEDFLTDHASEQFQKSLDAAIWNGNGTAKPTGMTNTAAVSTADHNSPLRAAAAFQYVPTDNGASPIAFAADDVIDLSYTLNRAYRPNAKFACNQNTQAALRKLKSSNGDYYWQPSFQAGQPDRLMGYPVFTWEDMADPGTADGLYLGFGDFKKAYTLPYRNNIAVTVDNNITTPGYVKFFLRRRYAGIPCNNDAVKFLKLAAT